MKIYCQRCGNEMKDGVVICPKCGFENKVVGGRNIKKVIFLCTLFILFLAIVGVGMLYYYGKVNLPFFFSSKTKSLSTYDEYLRANPEKKCEFTISDLKEYKSGGDPKRIEEVKKEVEKENTYYRNNGYPNYDAERKVWEEENYRWFYYEGIIRNTSKYQQYLININAKLRTGDNIFIKEGWSGRYNKWLDPGEGIPFKVTVKVDSEETVIKYILNKNITLKTDLYPWFDSCSY